MQPEFVRVNQAIQFTLEFYEIGKIKDYIEALEKNQFGRNPKHYLEDWYDTVFLAHERMEGEINQVIHTTTPDTKVYFFETLKDWLTDVRLKSLNVAWIIEKVFTYNDKKYTEFLYKVEEEIIKHQQTNDYKNRKDGEEYETVLPPTFLFGFEKNIKIKNTFHKIYCIEDKPDLIDTTFLKMYLGLVQKLVENWRRIATRYTDWYDEGKISLQSEIVIHQSISVPTESAKMIEPPKESKKLKVNLSVAQLVYLFRLLYDFNLLDASTKSEVKQFIIANFSTKSSEEISDKSVENKLSTTEKAEADFWADKLMEMYKAAKKV